MVKRAKLWVQTLILSLYTVVGRDYKSEKGEGSVGLELISVNYTGFSIAV